MKKHKLIQNPYIKLALFIPVFLVLFAIGCDFKSHAEASIKGSGGSGVLKVEVVSGAEFETKGVITPEVCEEVGYGQPIVVAECDVIANVTRKVQTSDGGTEEVVRSEVHTLQYKVACIPGTEWEVDCSDPVILQVPIDWNISNAIYDNKNGVSGNMVVDYYDPPADENMNFYVAEPGYKLVVIGFPYGTPIDAYDIDLEWDYQILGHKQIKGVFAAAVHYIDPNTGDINFYFPPAFPEERDFSKIHDYFYIGNFTAAKVSAYTMNTAEASNLALPDTDNLTYVAFSMEGADVGEVDVNDLRVEVK
ncbi:MAG: hypothetical protein DWQ02_18095 [Bacteroidetes bacterium]|nr:MAG: hypothetical protein DWQ02_18095 [Bacteroidota bacterium]